MSGQIASSADKINKPPKKRRILLRGILTLAFLVLFWYINNYTIKVTHTALYSSKVSDDIKLILLSDLHGMEFGSHNAPLLKKIREQNPDAVLIAGDMHTNYDAQGMEIAVDFLNSLTCPVFFIYGEHDRAMYDYSTFNTENIHVLNPDTDYYYSAAPAVKTEEFTLGDTTLDIVGINYVPRDYNIADYAEKKDGRFTIVLSHIFNHDAAEKFGADLTLCGDTHGGIVRIPFLGAAYYNGEWFPSLSGKKPIYDKGLFEYDGGYAYISGGLGAYPYPLRLFNRPEINVITIKPMEKASGD